MNYGTRLKEYINSSKWSKTEFAEQLEVSKSTLHAWIKNPYPKIESIERVCKVLDVSLGEFFDDTGAYELVRALKRVI